MEETYILQVLLYHTSSVGMATHSSILAWEVTWTEEPGGVSESDTT